MDYRQQYQNEWDRFIDAGGEGCFRATERTSEQIAEREVSIEESIALEMLRADRDMFGIYQWAEDYVQNGISDSNFAGSLPIELIHRMESMEDRTARDNGLARLYLADAVVKHRRLGFSGGQHLISLGFGVSVTTSLASEIVSYHRRMFYVQ